MAAGHDQPAASPNDAVAVGARDSGVVAVADAVAGAISELRGGARADADGDPASGETAPTDVAHDPPAADDDFEFADIDTWAPFGDEAEGSWPADAPRAASAAGRADDPAAGGRADRPSLARAVAFADANRAAAVRLGAERARTSTATVDAPAMPTNPDCERAIISAALIDPGSVYHALGRVTPEDFWDRRLALLWAAITTLTQQKAPIDAISVSAELRRINKLDAAGGLDLLIELASFVGSAQAMEHYATTVARIATVRRLLEATHAIQAEGYQRGADPDHVISVAQTQLRAALDRAVGDDAVAIASVVGGVFQNVLDARDRGGQVTGIPTAYRDFDRLMLGLHRTDLVILAARPAMGKTSLALNLALNVARTKVPSGSRAGEPGTVLVFSLEMGREQLVQRLLSQKARVGLSEMRRGTVGPEDEIALRTAAAELSELKLYIDDTPGLNTVDLGARAKRIAMREGLDLIVVDYLQLMRGTGGSKQSREQEISEISRTLKGLAKELNVTVLALSQLNRGLESRADKRPIMSDLRESGAIEQDADIILFIYRDCIYNKQSPPDAAELIIAKHRAGPTGMVDLRFDGAFTRFYNRDDRFGDEYVGVPAPRFG